MASYDIDKGVKYIIDNAQSSSQGQCAKYVRRALEAGGLDLSHHPFSAKDYGPTLVGQSWNGVFFWDGKVGYPKAGMADLPKYLINQCYEYIPKKGDVVVIQPYPGGEHGHITMYSGEVWYSDFKQKDMWSGYDYRKHTPAYVAYRS